MLYRLPIYLLVMALSFCVSCAEAPEGHPLRAPQGEIIGHYYQNQPIGVWTYYDENKHAVKQIYYFDSTGGNYQARYYARGKLVYLERIENHALSYQQPRVDKIEQGQILFHEYCQNCHTHYEAFIGPALYPVTRHQSAASFSQVASNRYHRNKYLTFEIPTTLTEHDFELIYEYIKQRSVVAN